MPRDYKDRASYRNQSPSRKSLWIKGIIGLLAIFIVILFQSGDDEVEPEQKLQQVVDIKKTIEKPVKSPIKLAEPKEPRYDFYIVLPEKEIIVPEYEINTLRREESFRESKKISHYVIQAGSFKNLTEANKLIKKITLLGVTARIEKATVGHVIWHRVKIGPYKKAANIAVIKKHLKVNGIDAIVTEVTEK